MLYYPKIETLYRRDEATHYVTPALRRPEFAVPQRWLLTEKIDGTNIRIPFYTGTEEPQEGVLTDSAAVGYCGRTDQAQIPNFLVQHLRETFTLDKMRACFDPGTKGILFGEGYGERIQKGGGNYRSGVSFRLFDVVVFGPEDFAWWLNWNDVEGVAAKLRIETVPVVSRSASLVGAISTVQEGLGSAVAFLENRCMAVDAEGIVARTDPLLFDRRGQRLVWKLKARDFPMGMGWEEK